VHERREHEARHQGGTGEHAAIAGAQHANRMLIAARDRNRPCVRGTSWLGCPKRPR
jgi:hypothetical protein